MNRSTRTRITKSFVPGGVYNRSQISKPLIQYSSQQQQQPPQQIMHVEEASPPISTPQIITMDVNSEQTCEDKEMEVKEDTSMDLPEKMFENGKLQFKKIFQKRKKSSERAREKKIRQNRQLRKAMLPKNALMALNELKGVVISDFIINSNVGGGFTASVTVNDIQYEGKGSSKMAAKSDACEKALRNYIVAKMVAKSKNQNSSAPAAATNSQLSDVEPMSISEDPQSDAENSDSDIPMINLASFAIYKLFLEWEKEGVFVPEMHPHSQQSPDGINPSGNAKESKKLTGRNELPTNWRTLHPATLLCMMRPGINYVDQGTFGDKPNVVQRLGVIVDDQEFSAEGRSKKIARRNVAIEVCNKLFGTTFLTEDA